MSRRLTDAKTILRRTGAAIVKNEFLLALCVGVIVIVSGVALGYENNKLIPANPAPTAHYIAEPGKRLSFMSDWDGPIYLNIATHGYTDAGQTNFFPLYPLLVRVVNIVVGSPLYSGLLIAWAAFIGAIYFFLKIIKQLFSVADNLEALRGTLFFVLFPTGVFLLATYTESLFALVSLGALYFALQKRYLLAALGLLLATATHATGLFVVALIALLMWEQGAKRWKIIATAAAGCLGFIAYLVYLRIRFHNALAFINAQKTHSGVNVGAHHLASLLVGRNLIFIVLLIVAVIYWWRRRKSFAVYTFLYLCILFISSQGLSGFGRYSLMAFPAEFMLYDYFRNRKVGYSVVLAVSAVLWAYFLLQYAAGYTGG